MLTQSQRKLWYAIGLLLYWLCAVVVVVSWNNGPDALFTPAWAESWGLVPWIMKEQTSFTATGIPVYTIQFLWFGAVADAAVLLMLLVAAVLLWRYLVKRFPVPNGCDGCGYPRSGASEVCPECGHKFHGDEPAKTPAVVVAILLVGGSLYLFVGTLGTLPPLMQVLNLPLSKYGLFQQWHHVIGLGIMLIYIVLMILAQWRHKKRSQSLQQRG